MQYRRLHLALLLMLLGALSVSGAAQTATYHLHKEASTLTAADDKLLTAGPDGTSLAITTALTGKVAGEYLIKEFETQTGTPATAGVIPSGSTLTFNLFMRKTANTGTVFPRAKIRLNNAAGTLLCTATGTTALTTTVAKRTISCTTTADIAMTATDRFYLWTGVNLTATSTTTFNGELDVEGTLNGNFDSTIVLPLGSPAPTVTSLTPATGAINTSVVIAGANFRATQGTSKVTFNGIASTPTVWSATSITAPVPTGAATGPVIVTVGGQASNATTFTVTPAPAISSLSPNSGAIGSVITINGTNFGPAQGNGGVKFGTVVATVSSWSPTGIVVTVPTGAVTGSVVVTAAGGVASAGVTFTVTAAPAITTVAPTAGAGFGASFTITGTNFGATQGNGGVTLNTIPATVTSWSATSIVAQVPSGVTSGNVVVTAAGGISSNGVRLKVLNPGGLAVDQTVSTDGTAASTTRATGTFSTSSTNELLLAFVSSGKGTATTTTVTGVAGASLTWVLVQRTNTQLGTSEIWRTFAPTALTNVTVTATFSQSVESSITVATFTGADTSGTNGSGAIGATASANGATGAPSATLTTTRANSVVFAVGDDPTAKVNRTIGANQSLVHQFLCSATGQTCSLWVQQTPKLIPTTGTAVTINDTAPTADAWNLSLVEIKPAATVVTTPSITSLTPTSGPIGTSVTIAGSNFGSPQGSSTVTFGGINATITSWSNTSIVAKVPAGVALGAVPVVVTVPGAGTSNSVTFTVVNPLAISAIAAPPPNANGWNNTNVTVSYSCSGGVAPIQCPGPQTVTTEGANQVVAASATDAIGEVATVSVSVSIDKTNPIISASVSPAPVNGVVTAPATVTFTCSDALSGVASCPAPIQVNTPGANQTFNGTATDRAGNSATTSITFSVETAVFSVIGTPAPPANANGWNNTSVTITYACSGGVAPVQCPAPRTITVEGANQIISATAADGSGQTASTSTTLNIDKTPPTITASVVPAPGTGGVVTAPAVITFVCSDALSGTASCSSPITVTTAGGGQTFNGTVTDKAGNSASTSVTISVQLTPLTITASSAPAANAAGWNNTSVTVSFLCAGGVPPLNCPAAQTLTAEGANQIVNGTVTDSSAQTASTSITISIDETPPTVSAAFTPAPNANGIVTAPATITFTCSDGLSGIAVCPSPITVTTAGASQAFSGTATDKAGNTASASVNLTVQTAPLTVVAVAAPAPNAAGWNNSPVTVSFVCSGGVPPLNCPAAQTASLEGANQIISGSVSDAAGQSASASVTLNIDLTPPTISADISPVQNNSGIIVAPSATITFTCTDTLSGVFNCPSPITVNTSGLQTFTGTATDIAGNTATSTVQVNLQTNPPLTVKASVSPTPNDAGWINSQATVSFQCDGGIPPINCPASIPVSTDGANQVFSGTATDASGASATDSVTINVDQTAPLLAITSPADGSVSLTTTVPVTGLVSDSGSGLASVTCNGVAASFSASDFNCSVQTTNGTLALSVQAVDVAGNTSTTTISATLQGPKLTVTSPAPLALFANNSITVNGTVDDPNAVVTVNGIPATITNGTFTAAGVILREGSSVVTATGTNTGGAKGTASVNVVLDTTPPIVTIDSPSDGVVVTTPQIYVTGMVNDVVPGSVNSAQVTVTLNGVTADVSNRTFMAEDILLVPGKNVLTAVAKDRAGNVSQSQITVTLLDSATQQRILMVSGNGQTAPLQSVLPQPLVIQAINGLGQAIPNLPVTYTVNKSDGTLSAFPQQGRQITVQTDADGRASVNFQVGTRVGKGNNQVLVTSPGFIGEVMFCSDGTVGAPLQIHDIAGEGQTGVVGQPLAQPMVVVVFDVGGNAVPGVPVVFNVEKGGGTLEGSTTVTKVTDSDGRASTTLVLAQEEGVGNNVVSASFDGLTGSRAAFVASGVTPSNAANTTVTGIVLDGGNSPVVNATASIQGTNLTALTDTSGRFTIANAPVGSIDLFIDGSTSTAGEPYPFLEFPLVTIAGQDNHLPSPIYLPELDFDNSKVVGGDEDVTLTMKGMPGVQFTVLAHSATFPDGSKVGRMSVSQVHSDKVPMPPPNATAPHLFWTVQPPRVRFDPPMRIQIPNTEGIPAGTVTEIFCYNHDLEEFASGGTARVSEDGAFIVSDKGSGVIVSGWGDAPPPPPPPTCADGCGKCGVCKDGACVIDPPLDPVGVTVKRSFGLPSETVSKINEGLAKLSTLGILAEVNLLEIEGSVSIKECCDAELGRGHVTKGSVTGNFGGFTVNAKIWPPGPIPTIDVTVAVLGLASLEVKAQFVGGFFLGVAGKVEGEVGFKQNDCKEEDKDGCFFASLKTGVTFTASLQVGASVEVTTDCFFCVKTTTSAEGTLNLGKFSLPLNIAAISYNDESCHAGVKGGTWQFEPGTAEISATFKGKWAPEGSVSQGFNFTFNFLKCSISLDTGIDCKSAL